MQLKSLYIKDYKILKDFTIEFPYDYKRYISVFIGANGSGKSTILEAIAQIFSDTILNQTAKFGFELEYSVKLEGIIEQTSTASDFNSTCILVTLYAKKGEKIKAYVNSAMDDTDFSVKVIDTGKMVVLGQGKEKSVQSYLPDNIIIYYSGLSEIMENLCKPHEEKLSKAYRKGNTDIDRKFFYFKPEHFEIILLSLLSYEYGNIPDFLRAKAQIERIHSIQIILKEPIWADSSSVVEDFWGASGNVRRFLDFICHNFSEGEKYDFLDYSIIKKNIKVAELSDERLQISIKDHKTLFVIKEYFGEERLFFEVLSTMHHDDLIDSIDITFIKNVDNQPTLFSILSEGEQQAIITKGMTELLSGKNTLFLFDEPDTYLHPRWQSDFFGLLNNSYPENYFLISTHSSLMLSNLKDGNIFNIKEGVAKMYNEQSYGKDSNFILRHAMNALPRLENIEKRIEEVEILIKSNELNESKKMLAEISEVLGANDPTLIRLAAIIKRKEIIGR